MAWRRRSILLLTCSLLVIILGLPTLFLSPSLRDSPISVAQLSELRSSIGHAGDSLRASFKHDTHSDPPPVEPPWGALVIAGQGKNDVSWVRDIRSWEIYNYDVDARPDHHNRFKIPENKGREAMVYLSFIIDRYYTLPWSTIFIHGHLDSWHQEFDVRGLIDGIRLEALQTEGYISLRCDWFPSCPAEMKPVDRDSSVSGPGFMHKETEAAIAGNWRSIFPIETLPKAIASQCCAQFAVTRQAIQRRPKGDYERMRQWLLESLLKDEVSGRVFEKLWAYIFTGQAVRCPPPHQCACEYFGRCGPHSWTKAPNRTGTDVPSLPRLL